MRMRWITSVATIIVLVLMLAPHVAAIGDSILPSVLIGLDITQNRALLMTNANDKQKIADKALAQGDYERAVQLYDLAEKQLAEEKTSDTQRDWLYYGTMKTMEQNKIEAFKKMGGHENEIKAAEGTIEVIETRVAQVNAKEEGRSGCLIVTATFGSPLSSEVQLVRDYRDVTIKQSYSGSQFVIGFNSWYYSFSPAVSNYISTHPLAKTVMQTCLVPLLEIVLLSQNLYAILAFSPELATVTVLLFGAVSYGLIYIFPLAFLTVWLVKRKGGNIPSPTRMKPVFIFWVCLLFGLCFGVFLSFDLLTIVTSGLLVACTIILIAVTASLTFVQYLPDRSGSL